ncbi:MAG: thymidine phosphorylase [Dinoroseobacter sp.]|nr:thymidine phosphorylase [Dinoroseobacter sp.]
MDARTIIAKIRDNETPTNEELFWFANGLASGDVTDAQAGAFAMSVVLNGLGDAGRVALTKGMRDSGDIMHWDLDQPVVDKHSTGGVGDTVSLLLAPALAACDVYVPMVSGRGLGHTGGTLDKLDAIDGYRSEVNAATFRKVVKDTGACIAGATGKIAPADKRLYLVRDVTSTVESVDLITASILSKKLSAGLEALVMDVKCGSGAFMKTPEDARTLAKALVETGNGAGCKTCALITDMSQPLAPVAGNALEVAEVLRCLRGEGTAQRMVEVTCDLGGALLALIGVAKDEAEGRSKIAETLAAGHAAERFGRMVSAMGGPSDVIENGLARLPEAPVVVEVLAGTAGVVQSIDTEALGEIVVHLGGGRLREDDKLDLSVGLTDLQGIGASLDALTPLARIHAATEDAADAAVETLRGAYQIGDSFTSSPLVLERIG